MTDLQPSHIVMITIRVERAGRVYYAGKGGQTSPYAVSEVPELSTHRARDSPQGRARARDAGPLTVRLLK